MPIVTAAKIPVLRFAARAAVRGFRGFASRASSVGEGSKEKEDNVSSAPHPLDASVKEYLSKIILEMPWNYAAPASREAINKPPQPSAASFIKPTIDHDSDEDGDLLGGILKVSRLSKVSNCDPPMRGQRIGFEKKRRYLKGQEQRRGSRKHAASVIGPDPITSSTNTCLKKAKSSLDTGLALDQTHQTCKTFKVMKERGLKIDEEVYGQLLLYLIDNEMVDEFFLIIEVLKDDILPRLAYYKMLLWTTVNDETRIQLFHLALLGDSSESCRIKESLLLALTETDHREKVLLALKQCGIGAEKISSFIEEHAARLFPRFTVE